MAEHDDPPRPGAPPPADAPPAAAGLAQNSAVGQALGAVATGVGAARATADTLQALARDGAAGVLGALGELGGATTLTLTAPSSHQLPEWDDRYAAHHDWVP
jgi:hypothetical protein